MSALRNTGWVYTVATPNVGRSRYGAVPCIEPPWRNRRDKRTSRESYPPALVQPLRSGRVHPEFIERQEIQPRR